MPEGEDTAPTPLTRDDHLRMQALSLAFDMHRHKGNEEVLDASTKFLAFLKGTAS